MKLMYSTYCKPSAINNSNKIDIDNVSPRFGAISLVLMERDFFANASTIYADIQPIIGSDMLLKSSSQIPCTL